jgi:hypothetical protein
MTWRSLLESMRDAPWILIGAEREVAKGVFAGWLRSPGLGGTLTTAAVSMAAAMFLTAHQTATELNDYKALMEARLAGERQFTIDQIERLRSERTLMIQQLEVQLASKIAEDQVQAQELRAIHGQLESLQRAIIEHEAASARRGNRRAPVSEVPAP